MTQTLYDKLNGLYPDRISVPEDVRSIPRNVYMVYVLGHKNNAIVVGHGKKNRASIIFDNLNRKTPSHIKALLVRTYCLVYQDFEFDRYIISCRDKDQAQEIEKYLHKEIGGNSCEPPEALMEFLVADIKDGVALLFLKLAVCSSFDGLNDLKKWRDKKLIPDSTWNVLSEKLRLSELNWS
ncbi:MAG: hypothetical protein AB7V18_20115 [Pyrinomonadaceae bacterium]